MKILHHNKKGDKHLYDKFLVSPDGLIPCE